MNREYKIYDNGNKCSIVKEYEESWDFDFERLIGDDPFGILGCNLRSYSLEHNAGNLKTTEDIFYWVMKEKKIKSFNFTVKDVVRDYGSDVYVGCDGDDVKIEYKSDMTVEELRDVIIDMADCSCFDDGDLFNIINETRFEDIIIKPFYAYIHSGISVSLGDYGDPWDSGIAGFAWMEPREGETLEEAEKYFKEDFSTYDDYICGYYNEYNIMSFEKENREWKMTDDFWTVEKSFEDAWENLGKFENIVEDFSEEDKDLVRREISIDTEEVLNYLSDDL